MWLIKVDENKEELVVSLIHYQVHITQIQETTISITRVKVTERCLCRQISLHACLCCSILQKGFKCQLSERDSYTNLACVRFLDTVFSIRNSHGFNEKQNVSHFA